MTAYTQVVYVVCVLSEGEGLIVCMCVCVRVCVVVRVYMRQWKGRKQGNSAVFN